MKSSFKELFQLHEKVAVVTGALGILGRQFSSGLAEFGANVVIVDVDEELCKQFAKQLSDQYKVKCFGIGCDVSSPQQVKNMVKRIIEKYKKIDILHNNAATKTSDLKAYFTAFEDYDLAQWRDVMAVNIDGMFLAAQQVGKEMVKQKKGTIIQTSSIYGIIAPDHRIYEKSHYLGTTINTPAVYAASKAAVWGLTKYLATYWAEQGIRVNMLTPGGMESGQNEKFKQNYSYRTPMARMGNPDELVGALIYLASDASSYVTGQNMIVDGGLSIW
ncbi:short-chain dehydrogenase [Salipaludibacillus neizhouensis]|uniref:Short-chain dehydrogenase n=1 Tax=Salipaludibacillus neizhouensis TaxID=885475 RepID=A0A3A9KEV4_9BACI|nr:SDR family oxidoreductase [Salipaludibacillus neizhouensis]RKL69102.1 short-chain dehydrogenase [Salipaludibacillus neizhouensis]